MLNAHLSLSSSLPRDVILSAHKNSLYFREKTHANVIGNYACNFRNKSK